ncbi:ParM/StbA family protein [Desulfallas sp. Bu1-1]|uniref:ParM/StbA family protein n=1 Tax=Desulfallas sp. Bu1-1 TaxID=2787620 RepID=UPI0028BE8A94|nr:ParM/StbA family protein [Desulfallas sp. Bu1-1]
MSQNGTGHTVEIRTVDGKTSRHFVGDLALHEGHAASFTLEREKHKHPNHDVLMLTAATLLGAGVDTALVAGLPVAYYRSQKEKLKHHLENLHAVVTLDGKNPVRISFGEVIIYPQGAGALLTVDDLPDSGLVTLIDVGHKTTNYVNYVPLNFFHFFFTG